MKNYGYTTFIREYVGQQPFNRPIYTTEIAVAFAEKFVMKIETAKPLVNATVQRNINKLGLERYQKGIYYRAKETPFGKTRLNPGLINKTRYLERKGEVIGYETGAAFLNRIGLSTQIPRREKYATNVFKHRGSRTDAKLNVVIKKPKTTIDEKNYRYLQFLDAVENKDRASIDVENANMILHHYMIEQKLEVVKIMEFAGKYYNKKTRMRLFEIILTLP